MRTFLRNVEHDLSDTNNKIIYISIRQLVCLLNQTHTTKHAVKHFEGIRRVKTDMDDTPAFIEKHVNILCSSMAIQKTRNG